ncbi:GGDEF domain-containing protein [Hyphomicrobium sp.]|jgi:diguanylate cyclase|uniref:GGDEF domain-containing protein n=1 Tax=Hyphomicrobium sp. TaxID=82 RepID=UPI002CFDE018|nr:GGDEF domain-containing protein [Hyphomicrobium sp.]HVZ04403.1 GGDEF domain-containing protein [Hyphomicrobium sp.]
MSATTWKQLPSSAIIMLASLVAVCSTYFFWAVWMRSGSDLASWTSWSDTTWQIAEVDSRGRIIRLGSHPLAIAALVGSVTVCCLAFAFGAWQFLTGKEVRRRQDNDAISSRIEKVGQELDEEVYALMNVLKQHLDFSSSHSEALAKVNKTLPSVTSPEQIRAIVQRLINENTRIQNEVDTLNARVQHSQQQIEKLRASLSESQRLGMLDAVTHLKNRHWLEANLPREVASALEYKEPLSLVMADVDHFKNINDSFGHAVGDEILRRFAELLSKNIKGRDTAVRYGGEEFILVLPHTELEGAHNLGEQIRAELEGKKWMHHKTGLPIGTVTASFGVAQLRPEENPDCLLERADAKLYEAKAAGRNCVKSDGGSI